MKSGRIIMSAAALIASLATVTVSKGHSKFSGGNIFTKTGTVCTAHPTCNTAASGGRNCGNNSTYTKSGCSGAKWTGSTQQVL